MAIRSGEKGIAAAGSGWVLAGALSFLLYLYQGARSICSCPNIPVGTSAEGALAICRCPAGSPGLLAVGLLALVSGLWIIIARRRIARMRSRLIAGQRRRYRSK